MISHKPNCLTRLDSLVDLGVYNTTSLLYYSLFCVGFGRLCMLQLKFSLDFEEEEIFLKSRSEFQEGSPTCSMYFDRYIMNHTCSDAMIAEKYMSLS